MNKFAQQRQVEETQEFQDWQDAQEMPVLVVWKSSKQVVMEFANKAEFNEAFPNGLDEDNKKIFEVI